MITCLCPCSRFIHSRERKIAEVPVLTATPNLEPANSATASSKDSTTLKLRADDKAHRVFLIARERHALRRFAVKAISNFLNRILVAFDGLNNHFLSDLPKRVASLDSFFWIRVLSKRSPERRFPRLGFGCVSVSDWGATQFLNSIGSN